MLTTDDLVRGDNCFFAATGITDGPLLDGVRFDARGVTHPEPRHALAVGHRAPHRARHRIDKMNITLDANAPLDRSRWEPA